MKNMGGGGGDADSPINVWKKVLCGARFFFEGEKKNIWGVVAELGVVKIVRLHVGGTLTSSIH